MKRMVYYTELSVQVLLLLTVMTIVFMSCRDEEVDVCVENPCECTELPNADFKVYEKNYGKDIYLGDTISEIIADTFLAPSNIYFEAFSDVESYEWKVGTDARTFTERKFNLGFGDISTTITIRLIVKWTPNLACFPNDIGVDTVYQTYTFIKKEDAPLYGIYKGSNTDNPMDSFSIELNRSHGVVNFPNCMIGSYPFFTYKIFYMDDINDLCGEPQGIGILEDNHKDLTIDYEVYNEDKTERIKKQFKGIKIE